MKWWGLKFGGVRASEVQREGESVLRGYVATQSASKSLRAVLVELGGRIRGREVRS